MKFWGVGRIVLVGCACALLAMPQSWVSVGAKGGVALTDAFADRTYTSVIFSIPNPFGLPPFTESESSRFFSGSRSFVVGPTIEVQLPLGLAVEADALYRPLYLNTSQTFLLPNLTFTGPTFSGRVDTFEFPLLAKYRLPVGRVKPFLEAGPMFRVISSSPARNMSGVGISAGVGVEVRVRHLRIAPEVRYTHWGSDGAYGTPFHATAYPNQVEFLTGISTAPSGVGSSGRATTRWDQHVSLGVKGGLPFTTAFLSDEYGTATASTCVSLSSSGCSSLAYTIQYQRASRNYLVGPMVEVHLRHHVSIEADGLYAPVSSAGFAPGSSLAGFLLGTAPSVQTYSSWQFPVVGKYKFSVPFASPYFEAGPTFRTSAAAVNGILSHAGVTAGGGVEGRVWRIRVSPEVRFVHWAPDNAAFYPSRRNQAQFLVGLSY